MRRWLISPLNLLLAAALLAIGARYFERDFKQARQEQETSSANSLGGQSNEGVTFTSRVTNLVLQRSLALLIEAGAIADFE